MKRKKKLKKGIISIEKQIKLHVEKREKSIEEGDIERAEYYRKEIDSMERDKKKKEKQLER